jgi:hypothetical protein
MGIWRTVRRLGCLRARGAPEFATVGKPPLADSVEVSIESGAAEWPHPPRSSHPHVPAVLENEADHR